jgi:GNAT superfamily N-acetyltransferase
MDRPRIGDNAVSTLIDDHSDRLDPSRRIELRELHDTELPLAAQLLARGMRDDPIHFAVFGPNPVRRLGHLQRFFAALLPSMGQAPLSAWDAGRLVGVLGRFPPDTCNPPLCEKLRMVLPLLPFHLRELWRLWVWTRASEAHDLPEPHWHLGPVAVDVDRQRQGIGTLLLREFCARMDLLGEVAFLETDKQDSVRFYARCGFQILAHDRVLGTPNWWMRRPPRPRCPANPTV